MQPTPAPGEPCLLNEGDEVAMKHGSHGALSVVKIQRVTPTQAILPNGVKLKREVADKHYLDEIGRDRWSQWHYWLPTEKDRAEAVLQSLRATVKNMLEKKQKELQTADLPTLQRWVEFLRPE